MWGQRAMGSTLKSPHKTYGELQPLLVFLQHPGHIGLLSPWSSFSIIFYVYCLLSLQSGVNSRGAVVRSQPLPLCRGSSSLWSQTSGEFMRRIGARHGWRLWVFMGTPGVADMEQMQEGECSQQPVHPLPAGPGWSGAEAVLGLPLQN